MKKQKKILVVDNDPATAKRIENILRSEGYLISSASDKEAAASMVREINPSLVIVSVIMPDGLDICKKIHSIELFAKTPIIILIPPDKIFKMKNEAEYGIVDSLNKTFNVEELIMKIETVLSITEITEADMPQYEPIDSKEESIVMSREEEDDFIMPPEKKLPVGSGIKLEPPLDKASIPLEEDIERPVKKSFDPSERLTLPRRASTRQDVMHKDKKKLPRVFLIILALLLVMGIIYFLWQMPGINEFIKQKTGIDIQKAASKPVKKVEPISPQKVETPQAKIPVPEVPPAKKEEVIVIEPSPEVKAPEPKPPVEAQKIITKPEKGKPIYSAQAGAFKNIDNAEAITKKLKGKGYDAFVQSTSKGNDRVHKVMVGKFESRKKAEELISTLKAKENIKAIIVHSE